MKKSFSGMLVAALAVVGVLGTSSKANAALLIDFDNLRFDGGTFTSLGGGQYSGSGILFDTILYKDSVTGNIAGAQCGVSTTSAGALATDACQLNFNTALNTFSLTAPTGLWDIGADFAPFTADRGGFIAGTTGNVLTGSFSAFADIAGVLFVGAGIDSKDPDLLAFFGLPANTTFAFATTEIHFNPDGQVLEADLTNFVTPEPATMMLLGTGLLAAFRARRKSA
jgi:PEP-CTERM motif